MNVTSFGRRVFADDQVNMRSLGGPIAIWLCPYKKGKFGHRDRNIPRECHVKMKAEIRLMHL